MPKAASALRSRSPISARRLLTSLDRPPALEGADEGHLVGVLEVAADRQAARDPADERDDRLQSLGQVHRRRLAFERRIGREDDLLERRPVAGGLIGADEQLADVQPLGTDPVDGRDRTMQDVVQPLDLAGALQGEDVERLLDDAQPALVTRRIPTDGAQRLVADVEARSQKTTWSRTATSAAARVRASASGARSRW